MSHSPQENCTKIHQPHGAPGDRWTCPDCGTRWAALDNEPLDIRWVVCERLTVTLGDKTYFDGDVEMSSYDQTLRHPRSWTPPHAAFGDPSLQYDSITTRFRTIPNPMVLPGVTGDQLDGIIRAPGALDGSLLGEVLASTPPGEDVYVAPMLGQQFVPPWKVKLNEGLAGARPTLPNAGTPPPRKPWWQRLLDRLR